MSNPDEHPSRHQRVAPASSKIAVRCEVSVKGIRIPTLRRAAMLAAAGRTIQSLSIVLVDDRTIAELHQRFMNDPQPTDVLSFDLRDNPDDGTIEGEVVVSVDTAARQAKRYRATPTEEILRYVIHGTLHLVGLDDHTPADRAKMRRAENRVLGKLKQKRPDKLGASQRRRPVDE